VSSNCPVHGRPMRGGFCPACAAKRVNQHRPPQITPDMFPPDDVPTAAFPPDDPPGPTAGEPTPPQPPSTLTVAERAVAARELHAQAMAQIAWALVTYVEHVTNRKIADS
jgi:hypothetical protein